MSHRCCHVRGRGYHVVYEASSIQNVACINSLILLGHVRGAYFQLSLACLYVCQLSRTIVVAC